MNTVSDFNLQDFVATRCAIADISLSDFGRKEIKIAEYFKNLDNLIRVCL